MSQQFDKPLSDRFRAQVRTWTSEQVRNRTNAETESVVESQL